MNWWPFAKKRYTDGGIVPLGPDKPLPLPIKYGRTPRPRPDYLFSYDFPHPHDPNIVAYWFDGELIWKKPLALEKLMKLVVIPTTGKGHITEHILVSELDLAHLDHAWIGGEVCKVMLAMLEAGHSADSFWIKVRFESK